MAESSNGHSRENRPPGQRSVTPHNLNLNLGTPRGEDEYHEEEEHMEQQNLGARGGGTPAQEKLFTPHVGSTAGYVEVRASRINTHERFVMEFCNKFLEEEPSMHIMKFLRTPSQSHKSYDITEAISTPSLEAFAADHRSRRCSYSRGSNRKSFISVTPLRPCVLLMAGARGVPVPGVPISRVPTEIVDEVERVITMEWRSPLDEDTLAKGLLKSQGV
ncbi:hypothetical protein PIB30_021062 [Stylosanthes scabra]|uniref:Uncharacterized protein n=1 Tax=Stylosanthes scabra TaxID=79078 RepID=A0ABU6WCC6_9FABA|nr:hypothetical protein [Stylosanthes scabra]